MPRKFPNIVITGTPGVGKSSIAKQVAHASGMTWYDISKLAVKHNMVKEYDEKYHCPIIDEESITKHLKTQLRQGNCILDFYSSDLFPTKYIDVIFVVQCDNTILYDRLTERGYKGIKRKHNLEYEIQRLSLEEAQSAYEPEIVHAIENNTKEQLEDTVNRICSWIKLWKKNNS